MAHVPAIDKEEVVAALLTGRLRLSHKAGDAAECGLYLYRQQILAELSAIDICDTLTQAGRLEILQFRPVVMEDKVNIGIHQYDTLEGLEDITEFRGIRLEELPSGRNIIEKILHLECTAHRTGGRFL